MIDLHCHSHFSDGHLSPDALLEKAMTAGIKYLALTDHDTTAGLSLLHQAAAFKDIEIIDGIELSTRWKKYDIHILGLRIDPEHDAMIRVIEQQNTSRIQRALEISLRLLDCGVENAYEKACDVAGHTRVGRPHFAQVLVNEQIVSDFAQAFKSYLIRGRRAYVPTEWISVEEAVDCIHKSHGFAVIAHPLKYKLTRSKLYELMTWFKSVGGDGIEVVSGASSSYEVKELAGICQRFDLFASSGSDFHGEGSQISLGRQQALPLNCTPIWEQWAL